MKQLWNLAAVAALVSVGLGERFTKRHEAGRCSIRGNCGNGGFFSPPQPCSDNGLAREPGSTVRAQLVELCGPKWSTGPICCEEDQVRLKPSKRYFQN